VIWNGDSWNTTNPRLILSGRCDLGDRFCSASVSGLYNAAQGKRESPGLGEGDFCLRMTTRCLCPMKILPIPKTRITRPCDIQYKVDMQDATPKLMTRLNLIRNATKPYAPYINLRLALTPAC